MKRAIFLDRGRQVRPTIWRRIHSWALSAIYLRAFLFPAAWFLLFIYFFPHHWIAVALLSIGLGCLTVLIWDAARARRDFRRMREESEFKVWFDQMNAIASQYGWRFLPNDAWRGYWRDDLTPEQALGRVKDRAEKAGSQHAAKNAPKITRIRGGLEG